MDYGFISCLPIIVLIVGALLTKRIMEMLLLATFTGVIILYKGSFLDGFVDVLYETFSSWSLQFVFIILFTFGGLIKLFQTSGAISGFGDILSKYASGPKKPLLLAWILGILMFVDDFLNVLTVGFSLRDLTDRNGIPREHLAMQAAAVASAMCCLVPFSSWAGFHVGLISEEGLGFIDYAKAIPFMFFPIIAVLCCLLLDIGVIGKFGALKESYKRVADGGSTIPEAEGSGMLSMDTEDDVPATSAWNVAIPLLALIVGTLVFDCDLTYGCVIAIIVQMLLYLFQKIMTPVKYVDDFLDGAKSMFPLMVLVTFAFTLSNVNGKLGFFEYMIAKIGALVPGELLPAMTFLLVAAATFATAGYWSMQVISVPIFLPLAFALNVYPPVIVAAIMSGVSFGCCYCFYSDNIIMTAASTEVSNFRQTKVSTSYMVPCAVLAFVCYLAAGFLL
ncbi:MAG: hypothetical protein IKI86_07275 [Firmicutes bacterium]|nr:hypothetical protein [Bacillota bacterium]MBR3259836.1 hypothetical protein [Bacillota bacterium]MBR4025065.1 hypothetical protein [Bacillota bacterium]